MKLSCLISRKRVLSVAIGNLFVLNAGLTAAQSRLVLERDDWAGATKLPVHHPDSFSWDKLAAVEAITHFARGVGAARSGDPATAEQSANALQGLFAKLEKANNKYWATLVDSQRHSVLAWARYAKGNPDEALALGCLYASSRP